MAEDRTTGRPDPGGDYTDRDTRDAGSRSVRLPGTVAPGAEGLTADDRTPDPAGPDRGTPARMPDDGVGTPSPGRTAGRESATTEPPAGDTWPTAPGTPAASVAPGTGGHAGTGMAGAAPLLAHDEADQWEQRLRHAVAEFVDEPRAAVEEADRALEEIATRFTDAVTRRRRTLRDSWQDSGKRGPGSDSDTERLRLALRDYRELAGRLLHN